MPRKKIQERFIVPKKQRTEILASCGNRCARCGKKLTWDATVEHVIPLSKGGTYDSENLVALCRKCNRAKSNDIVMPKEFYAALSPERRKKLQRMVDQYYDKTDWMDKTNLFKTDQFTMPISVVKNYSMPARIEKMRRGEVLEFMAAYQTKIGEIASAPDTEDQVQHPFYKIILQEKTVMAVSPYIVETDGRMNISLELEQWLEPGLTGYMGVMDVFVNPEIKDNGTLTTHLLTNILRRILQKVNETMHRKGSGVVMQMLTAAGKNDRFAERMLHEANRRDIIDHNATYQIVEAERNSIYAGRNPAEYNLYCRIIGDVEAWNGLGASIRHIVETTDPETATVEECVRKINDVYKTFWKRVSDRMEGEDQNA